MQVKVSDIKLKKRVRQGLDDIESLAQSMSRFGQLHPIVLSRGNVLVSGRRRLEAAKSLGWQTINAVIVDLRGDAAKLELELDENVQRIQLSQDEIAEGLSRLEKLRNPGFFRKIWMVIAAFFKRLFRMDD